MFLPSKAYRRLASALAIGLAALAQSASAGTVSHGDFIGTKASFLNVSESGVDIPPALFVPQTPVLTESPNPQLSFAPLDFVQTDASVIFDLKSKSSSLAFKASSTFVNDPSILGYAFSNGVQLNIAGSYSVWAPFAAGDMGAGSPASIAKATLAASYTAQVTGVNWQPYSGGSAIGSAVTITPSDVTVTGPMGAAVNGTFNGLVNLDWNALRTAAGVGPTDYITDIQFQFVATIGAAGVYGQGTSQVTNFNVIAPVTEVAQVPEPPTVILAGLGAAAVVGSGWRRKMLRKKSEDGAVAITA